MAKSKPELERLIIKQGGQVKRTKDGKVNIIYPPSWPAAHQKRK